MGRTYRKELSFQAGEISPLYFGRSETQVYDKGLAEAYNVVVDKRGGVSARNGLEYLAQSPGNNARVFILQVSRQRYYTIFIHNLEMIVIAPGAKVIGNNLLLNGNFASAGLNWSTTVVPATSRVTFGVGEARLLPEQNDIELVNEGGFSQDGANWISRVSAPQSTVTFINGICTLTPRNQAGGYAGIAQQIATGSPNTVHTLDITGDFGGNELNVRVGTAEADGSYLTIDISNSSTLQFTPTASPFFITLDSIFPNSFATISNVSILEAITKTSAISQQATVTAAITDQHIAIVGQQRQDQIRLLIGTTEGANDIAEIESTNQQIEINFIPNNATYWVTVLADGDDTVDAIITFVGTAEDAVAVGIGLTMPAPWTEDQLHEIHMIEAPEGKTLYFTHPNVPVQKLIYSHATDTFVPLAAVSFLNPPVEWTGTNHPSTGAHFQARLWLGGTPGEGQNIWASVSASPEDFTVTVGDDSSALEFVLQEFGRIEWILGTKNLLIGAENGEHIITSTGSAITPSDFDIQKQSSFGSNNMQAIQVGEKVFYLTPDGRKLRAMSYQWEEDNWLSQDLTFVSEHITLGVGKHKAWAQNPDNLFILSLEDGTIAMLTYDRTAETVAWTRIETPGMFIYDIASGRNAGTNELVIVGRRTTGQINIEINSTVKIHLDSYVPAFFPFGGNVITGLDHLEGLQVRPIVDGAIDPLQVVVGGQITTTISGNQLYAGIPYSARIKTLPPDVPNGQIRSFKKRWNKVWALLLDSKMPLINGIRPPERTPSTPMDTVEPNITGHVKSVSLGWDDQGQVTIEQDLPVEMTILAIYGEMSEETT